MLKNILKILYKIFYYMEEAVGRGGEGKLDLVNCQNLAVKNGRKTKSWLKFKQQ